MKINFKRESVAAWLFGAALIGIAGCGGGTSRQQPVATPSPTATPTPIPTPVASPTPDPRAAAGEILFTSNREVSSVNAGYKLFRANLDGSDVTYLPTGGTGQPFAPEWFPGRGEVLYAGVGGRGFLTGIRRERRDGTSDRAIVSEQVGNPSVSPDGSRIAYDDRTSIFVANADGTNAVRIGRGSAASWSPDGARLVFQSPASSTNSQNDISVINADGSGELLLTRSAEDDSDTQFSPDGRRIVYVSRISSDNSEIFVMDADGSNPTRLTNSTDFESNPRWTPDGNRIAFVAAPDLSGPHIFIMNANGSNPVRLFSGSSFENDFDIR